MVIDFFLEIAPTGERVNQNTITQTSNHTALATQHGNIYYSPPKDDDGVTDIKEAMQQNQNQIDRLSSSFSQRKNKDRYRHLACQSFSGSDGRVMCWDCTLCRIFRRSNCKRIVHNASHFLFGLNVPLSASETNSSFKKYDQRQTKGL